jgi:uncharacterized membrane protein
MKNDSVKKITGVAILIAIEVVLQIIGNYVTLGPISLNLALIPIALGAIMYGPLAGALLGLINGVVVLFAPSTQGLFLVYAPIGTVFTCLLKCTIAGFVSGLVYKLISKKNELVAVIVASLLVPVINTSLFALASMTIIVKAVKEAQNILNVADMNYYRFLFLIFIGWNFIFEFAITAALSPTVYKAIKIVRKDQ